MEFNTEILVDTDAVLRAIGYTRLPADTRTEKQLATAASLIENTTRARWVYRRCSLKDGQPDVAGFELRGTDIARHLEGCYACVVVALTLGAGVDAALRTEQEADMTLAVIMDVCASILAEQYADAAQVVLCDKAEAQGEYLTRRFSPGYGDLPLSTQSALLGFLDAGRTIGLTANQNYTLLPRKSITAILGVAKHPVSGRMAGCGICALREKCNLRREGKYCGKQHI